LATNSSFSSIAMPNSYTYNIRIVKWDYDSKLIRVAFVMFLNLLVILQRRSNYPLTPLLTHHYSHTIHLLSNTYLLTHTSSLLLARSHNF
jgi:hypothetical protein